MLAGRVAILHCKGDHVLLLLSPGSGNEEGETLGLGTLQTAQVGLVTESPPGTQRAWKNVNKIGEKKEKEPKKRFQHQ